nr:14517_t:CDS:2 [Entrophospora candida]
MTSDNNTENFNININNDNINDNKENNNDNKDAKNHSSLPPPSSFSSSQSQPSSQVSSSSSFSLTSSYPSSLFSSSPQSSSSSSSPPSSPPPPSSSALINQLAKDILQDLLDECVVDIMLEVQNEEKKSKFIITNELDELDPGQKRIRRFRSGSQKPKINKRKNQMPKM